MTGGLAKDKSTLKKKGERRKLKYSFFLVNVLNMFFYLEVKHSSVLLLE